MKKWLFKTEPNTYSFEKLAAEKKAVWDGVSNPLALKNLRQIAKGDLVFIYHTGGEKSVVGIAEAVSAGYPDPKQNDPKLAVVDLVAKKKLPRPVSLQTVKQHPALKDWELVRMSRLSVMPVTPKQWETVMELAQ